MGAEEDAAARRERLRLLRDAKKLLATPDDAPPDGVASSAVDNGNSGANIEPVEAPAPLPLPAWKEPPQRIDNGEEEEKDDEEDVSAEAEDRMPVMKFRNYLPHDEELQQGKVKPVSIPKFEDSVGAASLELEKDADPISNIAPKKPNADLRRYVQKRLDKLERRTQKALYEILEQQQKERQATEVEEMPSQD